MDRGTVCTAVCPRVSSRKVIIFDIRGVEVLQSSRDLRLSRVDFGPLGEARIRGLVEHKVLSLDQHQVAKEWCEEQRAHHRYDQ